MIEIQGYKPASDDSTACSLKKWTPVTANDINSIYPSQNSVLGSPSTTDIFEIEYHPLMCLNTDIPQQ